MISTVRLQGSTVLLDGDFSSGPSKGLKERRQEGAWEGLGDQREVKSPRV